MRRLARKVCLVGAAVLTVATSNQALAQTDQGEADTRGVRIIAAPTPAPPSKPVEQPLTGGGSLPVTPMEAPGAEPTTPSALSPSEIVPPVFKSTPNKPSVTAAPTEKLLPGSVNTAPGSSSATSPPPAEASFDNPTKPPTSAPSAVKPASNKSPGVGAPTQKLVPGTAIKSSASPSPAPSPPAEPPFESPIRPPLLVPSAVKSAPSELPGTSSPTENTVRLPAASAPQKDLQGLASGVKVSNVAGLSLSIIPGLDITLGSRVFFQVSTKKPGYLILIDVDAAGKLTQIYPNPLSVIGPGGGREKLNFIQSGRSFKIPDRGSSYSGFEFVALPPIGIAMIIALLSDHPVQLVDLPNVPSQLVGSVAAVDYLSKLANELRIPGRRETARLQDAHWSFDVKFYAIK